MQLKRAFLIGLLLAGSAQAATAQQSRGTAQLRGAAQLRGTAQQRSTAQQAAIDPTRLGLDLSRIQRDLRQSASAQSENHGLKIRYRVDVYGQAPRIEFFTKEDNLQTGPVPYGAPTHREMINQVTPIEFRAPIMDFSALLRWLTDKADKK